MIVRLQGDELRAAVPALGRILQQCVLSGASVSFMHPFSEASATSFFHKVADSVDRNERIILAAQIAGQWAGSVQVVFATQPNQPHRAEIAKLLVSPDFRRLGIARQLMIQAESVAKQSGKTLLMLDTVHGDSAEPLYRSLGYTELGVVPNYALYPDGKSAAAIFFWKSLNR